jgi:GAF domain-containing protein
MDPATDLDELEGSAGTEGLLRATCRALTRATDADACTISRVLGDLLINVAEWASSGGSLQLGHGYLITDYPVTAEVLEGSVPRLVSLLEPDVDPSEAKVLAELGFDSLLMLSLVIRDAPWALVELYVSGRTFGEKDVEHARPIVQRAGEILTERLNDGRTEA